MFELVENVPDDVGIFVVSTGENSAIALSSIRGSYGELNFLINDNDVMSGNRDAIARIIEKSDMTVLVTDFEKEEEVRRCYNFSEASSCLGILTFVVGYSAGLGDGNDFTGVVRDLTAKLKSLDVSVLFVEGVEPNLPQKCSGDNHGEVWNAIIGLTELITRPVMVGIDFADIRAVFSDTKHVAMGYGIASGNDRAEVAACVAIVRAITSYKADQSYRPPNILVHIKAGLDLSLSEFSEVGDVIRKMCDNEDTMVVVGTVVDEGMKEKLQVTVFIAS